MFEGISLSDLENSEEAIVDITIEDTPKLEKEKEDKNKEKSEEDEGFSLSVEELEETSTSEDEEENKEDVEIKDTKTPASKSTKDEQKKSSQETFTSLASALVDAGVFSSLTDEDVESIVDADTILDAIAKEIKSKELSDLTDEQKEYVTAIRNGVPHDTYKARRSNIEDYNKLTDEIIISNQNLQFELFRRNFIIAGANEEKAKKMARLAISSDDAAEEALEAKNALVAYEEDLLQEELDKAETAKAEKLENSKKEIEALKSKINETAEPIPGIKVNSQTKDKIYESMVSPVNQKDNQLLNEVMEAYKSPEYKIKLHALHVITKGFTDFSKFINTQKSKAIDSLNEKLQGNNISKMGHNHSGITNPNAGKTSNDMRTALESLELYNK